MGTKQTNTQTGQFNAPGMAALNQITPAFSNAATGYIQNPFSNPFFQQQQQLGTRQAQNLGGTQMGNIAQNMLTSGIGGGGASPFQQEMMQNQSRANSGLQAQLGFMNPVSNALQLQQGSMGMAQGYRPLQIGQTGVQTTGGVGSWLPQLIGGALGAINPLKGLFGGGGGGGTPSMNMASLGGGSSTGGWANTGAPQGGMGGYGQNFPSPFFMQGGGAPSMPQGPQMDNSGIGPWFGNQRAPGGYGQGG